MTPLLIMIYLPMMLVIKVHSGKEKTFDRFVKYIFERLFAPRITRSMATGYVIRLSGATREIDTMYFTALIYCLSTCPPSSWLYVIGVNEGGILLVKTSCSGLIPSTCFNRDVRIRIILHDQCFIWIQYYTQFSLMDIK